MSSRVSRPWPDSLRRAWGVPEAAVAERLSTLHDRDGRGRIFQSLLADAGVADPDDTLAIACVAIYRANRPTLEPFPGVVPTLARLRAAGLALGLVSDGLASVQRTKLAALSDVAPLLDVIVLTEELGSEHEKPSPVPFRVATELLGTQPHLATYVGNDARKDFAGARLAGLRTIGSACRPISAARRSIRANGPTRISSSIGSRACRRPFSGIGWRPVDESRRPVLDQWPGDRAGSSGLCGRRDVGEPRPGRGGRGSARPRRSRGGRRRPEAPDLHARHDHHPQRRPAFRAGSGSLWAGTTLYDLYESAYTPWEWQPRLKALAESLGMDCFSSPFDPTAVDFLEAIDVPAYKVASFELVDLPLVRQDRRDRQADDHVDRNGHRGRDR